MSTYRLIVDNRTILGEKLRRGDTIAIDNPTAVDFLLEHAIVEPVDDKPKRKEKAADDGPPV